MAGTTKLFSVGVRVESLGVVCSMQVYIMADHYENSSHADFDVVRSTQFVDDMSCGVRVYRYNHFHAAKMSINGCLAICNAGHVWAELPEVRRRDQIHN